MSLLSYDADIGVLGEIPQGGHFDVLELNSTPIIAFASRDYPLASGDVRRARSFCGNRVPRHGRSWKRWPPNAASF